ncbi:MAG TPA: hypothetical protein V6D22_20040 [Candidatus Obscuribacterales bacterium]
MLLASLLLLSQAVPASAQYAQDNPYNFRTGPAPQPVAQQQQMPRLPDIGRPYAIRVTTGAHVNAGWEQALTSKDSNLKHWTWVPVTTFDQAYIGMNKQQTLPARPSHVYVKPTHLNEAASNKPQDLPPPLPQAHYVNPIHVPLPGVNHGPIQVAMHKDASTDVSATIQMPKFHSAATPVRAKTITYARTYGGGYSDVSGCVHPTYSASPSQSTSLHGKLLSHR